MLAPHLSAIVYRVSGWRSVSRRTFVGLAGQLVLISVASRAAGTNGTWIDTTTGGLWSATANWSGGAIANGADGIADFSTLNITADNTVHLDSARTIGQLKFGDTTPSNSWILDNNGNAANTLTMAVSSGSPQITVNNSNAFIILGLAGTGVVCNGPGFLVLSGTTDNTGLGLIVTAGNVALNKTSSSGVHAIGGGGLTINGGSVQLDGSGGDQIYDFANVTVSSGAFDAAGNSETFNILSLAGTGFGGNGALLNSTSGASTITPNGGTTLTANTTIGVLQSGGSLTLNNAISGNFGLTKVGPGTLSLNGNNIFTGGMTINAGTVTLGNAGALNATTPNAVTFGPSSTGTLSLNGYSVTVGGLSTNATVGTSIVENTGATFTTLTVNNAGNNVFAGTLQDGGSGALSLTKSGTGTLTLSGNNTFTGGVLINAGTIVLGSSTALGSAGPIMAVAAGATLDLGGQTVSPAPPLTIHGTGAGGNGALTNSSATAASYAGQFNPAFPGSFTIGGTGDITLTGGFGAPNAVTKIGTNTLTLSGTTDDFYVALNVNGGTVVLAKASTATVHALDSNLNVNAGLAQLGGTGGDQISDTAAVSVTQSGAAFDMNGRNETFSSLTLQGTGINGTGALVNSAAAPSTLTLPQGIILNTSTTIGVTQAGGGLTLVNTIGGVASSALTKVGLGTFFLNAPDIDTGPINVNSGTLVVNSSVAGDVVNGATFVYGGTGFGGRLTNTGITTINVDFAPGDGMENDGTVVVSPGVNATLNGMGLSNTATMSMTDGTLTLSPTGMNSNTGSIRLAGSARLNLNGASLSNSGMLTLDSALVNGAGGSLTNNPGGDISGTGTIGCSFVNSGLLAVGSGAMNITQAFTNSGVIQLTAFNSALTGGAITNTGSIQGLGNLSNSAINAGGGTIEAIGGTLFLGGTLANQSGATIRAAIGNKVLILQGLPTNAGIINLVGGTFDNNGQALNNTGQISGFGIFATGGTGIDNKGSITFSGGQTTVNGPVTNEGGHTITVAQNNAIFTGLVTNNASATFNAVNAVATFAGAFVNNGNSNFVKAGGGTVEIDSAPTLNNGSTLSVTTGTLRFNVINGAPTIGTGVTAAISAGATLELAGSVSALANGANRVDVTNNSTAPGVLVSGTNQQVGNIDDPGTTQVNGGSDLTANHVIQSALVIGGTAKNPGLVTIDASDSSGNPLGQSGVVALADGQAPALSGGDSASSSLLPPSGGAFSGNPFVALALADSSRASGLAAVPEPATILLLVLGGFGLTCRARAQLPARRSAQIQRR
jgi:autotransporter-associated beta strand protein